MKDINSTKAHSHGSHHRSHNHHHHHHNHRPAPNIYNWVNVTTGVFLFSNYYNDILNQARSQPVQWDEIDSTHIISKEKLGIVKTLDWQLRRVRERGPLTLEAADALAELLSPMAKDSVIRSVLAMIDFAIDVKHIQFEVPFFQLAETNPEFPFMPFIGVLNRNDPFIQLCGAKIIAHLLFLWPSDKLEAEGISVFYACLHHALSSRMEKVVEIVVQIILSLLERPWLRHHIYNYESNCIPIGLLKLLTRECVPQLQYQLTCCFWEFSFEKSLAYQMIKVPNLLAKVADVCHPSNQLKNIRTSMSFLLNICKHTGPEGACQLVSCKLVPHMYSIMKIQDCDDEMRQDLGPLLECLLDAEKFMTTFDDYISELASGKLDWSPSHTSELFWMENAQRIISEEDGKYIKLLAQHLCSTVNPQITAIAAHDIGQLSKFYPEGRRKLVDLGVKVKLMMLMTDANTDVRYQALIALKKFMSNSWNI